jgi:predicted nucleic acid-binding protein
MKDVGNECSSGYEFWAVATRPLAVNGLGMAPSAAESELTQIKQLFRLLDDTPAVYMEWEKLVLQYSVSGKNAHDTRIVAAMMVHHLSQLLTFNAADFQRFSGITVLTPAGVLKRERPESPAENT